MGQIIYYLTRYYSSTGSAAAALIVSIKQPPLSLSVSNYAIIGFLLSSTQLRKTLDFCYHESVTHAGMSSYGRVKYVGFYGCPPCAAGRTAGRVGGPGCARGAVGHIICVRVINRVLSHPSNPCTRMAEYQYDRYYVFI